MARPDNYALQAAQAKEYFLRYDQQALIRKLGLSSDESYLYTRFFSAPYRIDRHTGDIDRRVGEQWQEANSFAEVMTLLDLVCDSREDRRLTGRWKNLQAFGNQFHRGLLEEGADPAAEAFAADLEGFCRRCEALGGERLPQGDAGYAIEMFDGLKMGIQLWVGDEEFPSRLKFMFDENALQYLKYETMHFVKGHLLKLLRGE